MQTTLPLTSTHYVYVSICIPGEQDKILPIFPFPKGAHKRERDRASAGISVQPTRLNMQLILVVLSLSLIAGTLCQLIPTSQQVQCATDYINGNSGDPNVQTILANCRNDFQVPNLICENEVCLGAADAVYRRCGYPNARLGEFGHIL